MKLIVNRLLRGVRNHASQEAPGRQKQAALVVLLAYHQRRELCKRKPRRGSARSGIRIPAESASTTSPPP